MGKAKILLVDDDALQRDIFKEMLSGDYDVTTLKSGSEAIEHLGNNDNIPALILLDIFMPGMDGWEVFDKINEISVVKNVPIAFLTITTEKTAEIRALEMGAAAFITKSNNPQAILAKIKNILEKK
jgi:CheY-like chemotaxis protein